MEKPCLVEEGVYRVQLILFESLEHEKSELAFLAWSSAWIAYFAELHGWKDLTLEFL